MEVHKSKFAEVSNPAAVTWRGAEALNASWCVWFFPPPSQQVEVLRENRYKTWTFNKKTVIPVFLMAIVLPGIAHHYFKKEQVRIRAWFV